MSPWCSLVIPTRHRPAFVAQALAAFADDADDGVEIVVCDNHTDPSQSAEAVVRAATHAGIRYVRPPRPLGMVDNWSFALAQATGEYVGVLSDKIFMLPGALPRIRDAIVRAESPEILNWVSDFYKPQQFPDYFGAGTYTAMQADSVREVVEHYDPRAALDEKGRGEVARGEQTPSQYCRGKIVFGLYRRALLDRMRARFGAIFRDVSPDYSSMVLALSEARSAAEMRESCVVSMVTDLSNGDSTNASDASALRYLQQLSAPVEALVADMLIPGVYASQANTVARDYLSLKREHGLEFAFDAANWMTYCIEDLTRPGRVWSSAAVEADQTGRLWRAVNALPAAEQQRVVERFALRTAMRNQGIGGGARPDQQSSWSAPSLELGVRARTSATRQQAAGASLTFVF